MELKHKNLGCLLSFALTQEAGIQDEMLDRTTYN